MIKFNHRDWCEEDIIDWLITRKLDVNLLTVNLLTGGGSLTYYKPVVNRKRAGKSHNFDISMVQDYVIKVNGFRVQGNNLRLRLTMKNGREVSKGFSCNSLGKDDLEALAEIQDYLNTDAKYLLASELQCKSKDMVVRGVDFSLVKHLLSGTPEVKLRKTFVTLQCTSVHSIQQFKRFPLGLNTEVQVLKKIQNFVNSPGFSVWLTSVESCPGKWVQSQTLVLSEVNHFIAKLSFDTSRKYSVNTDILEDREHDPRILAASLVNRANGFWSHRPDDKCISHDITDTKKNPMTLYLNCLSNTVDVLLYVRQLLYILYVIIHCVFLISIVC